MRRAGQSEAVGNDVGAVSLDRLDMRGLDFGPAAPIDKLETGDRAATAICVQDNSTKHPIAYDPRAIEADAFARDIHRQRLLYLPHDAGKWFIGRGVRTRQKRLFVGYAKIEYPIEILKRD